MVYSRVVPSHGVYHKAYVNLQSHRSLRLPLVGGLDWLGFGFEPLLLEGKWETPSVSTKPPIQATSWEAEVTW